MLLKGDGAKREKGKWQTGENDMSLEVLTRKQGRYSSSRKMTRSLNSKEKYVLSLAER